MKALFFSFVVLFSIIFIGCGGKEGSAEMKSQNDVDKSIRFIFYRQGGEDVFEFQRDSLTVGLIDSLLRECVGRGDKIKAVDVLFRNGYENYSMDRFVRLDMSSWKIRQYIWFPSNLGNEIKVKKEVAVRELLKAANKWTERFSKDRCPTVVRIHSLGGRKIEPEIKFEQATHEYLCILGIKN